MCRLLATFPLLLLLTGDCHSGRRDFNYCDTTYSLCDYGHTCDFDSGLCIADSDAGIAQDASADEASGR